jgi:glycosyltransferase involved in cell wall biosynthesis
MYFRSIMECLRISGGLIKALRIACLAFRHEGLAGVIRRWSNANALVSQSGTPKNIFAKMGMRRRLTNTEEDSFVVLLQHGAISKPAAKLICFYLPQYHPIPENDHWWGAGFTEWTNVQPALPQFEGHDQPRIPGDLGYYNLLDPGVQRKQVEIARNYGIGGFCFYFYWFAGKRLLEQPLINYLENDELDLPFCLCWANENWSRRWDGLDSEVLIAQDHSPEDDLAFIRYVARYMRDRRYIRVNSKPLIVVYRPGMLPSASGTANRWRKWCADNGIGDIYLAYTQSFEKVDPRVYGFDAAIEFPPNNSAPVIVTNSVAPYNEDFGCIVYDWTSTASINRKYKKVPYRLFRGVCPSWDNTARRKNRSTILINSDPHQYQEWLKNAIKDTVSAQVNPEERLVFINAWNEWAEGAYLEPDARRGYAYLQATRNALTGDSFVCQSVNKIILVAHDAWLHGAQMLALYIAKELNWRFGFQVDLVCLGAGPLIKEYEKWARVHKLSAEDHLGGEARRLAMHLRGQGHHSAIVNSAVSGQFLETLAGQGIKCLALVHELRGVMEQYQLMNHATKIANHAVGVVFPADNVASTFRQFAEVPQDKVIIRPQGIYKRLGVDRNRDHDRRLLRERLKLPSGCKIIIGIAFADWRKGVDLFVRAALSAIDYSDDIYWVWNGRWDPEMKPIIEENLKAAPGAAGRILFPGHEDTTLYYSGADLFALTSREDPFPSVVLEAMDAGLPVLGFEGAGGHETLLRQGCGVLVELENTAAFGQAAVELLGDQHKCARLGARGAEIIREKMNFSHYIHDLLDYLSLGVFRVSVVVPNYNYAPYLPDRLNSIIHQKYPIYEIILLDDCSTDNSVEVARDILSKSGIAFQIIENDANSGSVFRQWKKGIDLSRGSHIWIAEADDLADPEFVEHALKGFRTPGVVMSYCESKMIDEKGAMLAPNYHDYVSDLDVRRWFTPFVLDGKKAVQECFCVKNIVPNVSAVIFDKKAIRDAMSEHIEEAASLRIAGDWYIYMQLLQSGALAFNPAPANAHRRHQKGVTISSFNEAQLAEIRAMQEKAQLLCLIDDQQVEKGRAYYRKLERQFGGTALGNA